jgi:hypothetical protein
VNRPRKSTILDNRYPTQPQNRAFRKRRRRGCERDRSSRVVVERPHPRRDGDIRFRSRSVDPVVMVDEEGKRKAAGDPERGRSREVPGANP